LIGTLSAHSAQHLNKLYLLVLVKSLAASISPLLTPSEAAYPYVTCTELTSGGYRRNRPQSSSSEGNYCLHSHHENGGESFV